MTFPEPHFRESYQTKQLMSLPRARKALDTIIDAMVPGETVSIRLLIDAISMIAPDAYGSDIKMAIHEEGETRLRIDFVKGVSLASEWDNRLTGSRDDDLRWATVSSERRPIRKTA